MPLALITGAAKRIGRMIAIHLAKNGFNLILHYNTSYEEILDLINDLKSLGVKPLALKIDFSDIKQLQAISLMKYKINVLINNAAIFENDQISDITASNIINHFQINCIAPIMTSKALALSQKSNSDSEIVHNTNIINITDSNIDNSPKNFTSYYLSKQSLEYFTKIAALQLAPIRVNAIALGYMLKNEKQSQNHFDAFARENPLEHVIQSHDLMQTIDYLINNQAITGQIIKVDAGYSIGKKF